MPAFLDLASITAALGSAARRFDIDLLAACDSTNSLLMARAEAGAPSGTAIVAEQQTAGRGRRGRAWISAPGDSLTFSLFWRFAPGTLPAGLSLAVGLAVARACAKVGRSRGFAEHCSAPAQPAGHAGPAVEETALRLKWPNDILQDGRKLGGILVELLPGSPHAAVIGIGINLRLPAAMPDELRATAAALPEGIDPSSLLATLLSELLDVLEIFGRAGFAPLQAEWLRWHAFQDRPVRLLSDFTAPREGICRGVDVDGALLFEHDGGIERVISGEVSLRGAP